MRRGEARDNNVAPPSDAQNHVPLNGAVRAWWRFAGGFLVPAAAAGLSPAVQDCNSHGQLTRHYTVAELRNALETMPVEIKEYTDCADVIQRRCSPSSGS